MKKLLLIMGDLAAGKSRFAGILSQRYHIVAFKKDTIKEVLGDTVGFGGWERNLELTAAAAKVLQMLFSELAKLDQDIILESNFRQVELDELNRAAEQNGYKTLTLLFCGDPVILHRRYLNRIDKENRHPVHLSVSRDTLEDFMRTLEYVRAVEVSKNVIHINANDFSYQSDKILLTKIDEFVWNE